MTWATMQQDDQSLVTHTGIPSLEQLQRAVGGLVEVAELRPDGLTMWVNEEGKFPWQGFGGNFPRSEVENKLGTKLMNGAGWFGPDWCAGDVAFTGGPDDEGNTTGLTDEQFAYLREQAQR